MATFDSSLGMWKAKNGRYFATEGEAQNADMNQIDDSEFTGAGGIDNRAPDMPQRAASPGDQPNPNNPGGISDNELRRRQLKLQSGGTQTANINAAQDRSSGTGAPLGPGYFAAGGAYGNLSAQSRAGYDYTHELGDAGPFRSVRSGLNSLGERVGVSHVGDVANPNPFAGGIKSPLALLNDPGGTLLAQNSDTSRGLGTTADDGRGLGGVPVSRRMELTSRAAADGGGGDGSAAGATGTGGPPAQYSNDGRADVDKETADAKNRALTEIDANKDENQQLFSDAFDRYNNLTGGDYGLGDEARGYQREGLQQQRMLLQKMLGYNEDAAATRYADQSLAREIAAGRSAGGGAAAQQAGMFAAMDQAPGLYAQGRQQAAQEMTTRLGQAETSAKAFGDLGTMTRGQDEQRAQFEASLGKGIADSVANLTQGNVQMNEQDSAQMAEIWMDFAKLQSVYSGMSSEEQLAWWQQETARRGQDQNFKAIEDQLKAQGKVTAKDLIGGLFTLGGGVMSAGGSLGNAVIQGQTARDVAAINAGA
jgi:hypothetical protein